LQGVSEYTDAADVLARLAVTPDAEGLRDEELRLLADLDADDSRRQAIDLPHRLSEWRTTAGHIVIVELPPPTGDGGSEHAWVVADRRYPSLR